MEITFEVFYEDHTFGISRKCGDEYLMIGPFSTFGDALNALPSTIEKEIVWAREMGINLVLGRAVLRAVPLEAMLCDC